MSTRSAIARPDGDGWIGVFHHWDGYPGGVGSTLWTWYHEYFEGDIERMTKFLIDDHPAGWETINAGDPRLGCSGGPTSYTPLRTVPECQGHDLTGDHIIHCQCPNDPSGCTPLWIEWAYVLSERGMAVFSSFDASYRDGTPPAVGKPWDYIHQMVAYVHWNSDEPDWGAIHKDASRMAGYPEEEY